MGVESLVAGTVGDDQAGNAVLSELRSRGLVTDAVRCVPDTPTGICVSVYRADGERQYLSSLGSVAATTVDTLTGESWPLIERCDLVLLTGLFVLQGLGVDGAATVFERLNQQGRLTLLDTGWDVGGWQEETVRALGRLLSVTDVFLPNQSEAQAIAGEGSLTDTIGTLRDMGPDKVIVKLGRDGAAGNWGDGLVHDTGFPRDVRDTTAAGEAFNAGVVYSLLSGLDLAEALRFANATASLFLAEAATTYPALDEIRALAQLPPDPTREGSGRL